LKTSSTFKNEAGSRYASSSKNAEEEKRLRDELKELDEEVRRLQAEGELQEKNSRDEELLEITLAELNDLKEFKVKEKQQNELLLSKGQSASGHADGGSSETLREIKQSIFELEGHLSFLLTEKRAMDEFVAAGKQELLELQMEQIKL
ncbi:hypothetical protein EV174_007128, partial [Coemansia sp. RSA 2320]